MIMVRPDTPPGINFDGNINMCIASDKQKAPAIITSKLIHSVKIFFRVSFTIAHSVVFHNKAFVQ